MIKKIGYLKNHYFPKGSFTANVLILMTGTTLAQAITIAISPILTRIYSPDDFGIFALYFSIVSIISVLVTGKYELAIMLPEKDEDAVNIVALSIFISFFVSLITLLAIWIFNEPITIYFGNSEISTWLYFIPLIVLLAGIYNTLNYWSNRKKQYKRLAISRISQSGATSGINLGLGFSGFGESGLILGGIGGQTVATGVLGWQVWKEDKEKRELVTNEKIIIVAKKYGDFPKYSIPSDILFVLSNQLPLFMLNLFNVASVGFYSLTLRVLASPIGLIAGSILDVFKQRASSDYMKYGNCSSIYLKTFRSLIYLSMIPFLIFYFSAPYLFTFIFGTKWRIAGEYAQILSIMYFLKFISSPLSYIYYIAGRQKEDLLIHIYIGVSTFFIFLTGYYISEDIKTILILFSINYSIIYLIYLIRSYKFSKNNI